MDVATLARTPQRLARTRNRLFRRTPPAALRAGMYGVFLVTYAVGCVILLNTAHQGGRVVHELGVRAPVTSPATARNAPTTPPPSALPPGAIAAGDHEN